ncbi:MAG: purine-nucleoside phosphorylase [Gemmatimonadota bacterium]
MTDVDRAASILRSRLGARARVAIVLGSGLGHVVEALEGATSVGFEELPGFPSSGVVGHAGRFVAGRLGGADVLVQAGRYHFYEGHPTEVVAAPVRVAAALGIEALVLTNAAGGVRADLEPGDLLVVSDHLNLMGRSPLVGPARAGEVRFPDMGAPYDPELRRLAVEVARERGAALSEGIYAGLLGPAYETAAEVRMLGGLGADVVGMSTVPEVLVARARGIRCLAFSVVTNKATGLAAGAVTHDEVVAVGRGAGERLADVLEVLVPRIVSALSRAARND